MYDAIILGAGASGLFCAMTALARGRKVLLVDRASAPGRKLSITGGGKCNLSNRRIELADYASDNPDFCRSALSRFTTDDIRELAARAGITLEEREYGQLFCSRSAKDLVRYLAGQCRQWMAGMALQEKILRVTRLAAAKTESEPSFSVRTSGAVHTARNVVVATGSPAWPQVGATGIGYEIARSFGHEIVPIRPALCGLVMPGQWPLSGLSGISLPVSIRIEPAPTDSDRGKSKTTPLQVVVGALPLLFTHKGISGPAALQTSLYWRHGDLLRIDFLPETTTNSLFDAPGAGKALCRTILRKQLPDRLCEALIPADLGMKKAAELSRKEREQVAAAIHAHYVVPAGNEGYARAEVAAGGVSTRQVSSRTMESLLCPGLYFCGEVLDVTGRLGGYNLHWAFASGKAAGECI